MEELLKTLNLSDDNEIFSGYTTMLELCNALKFITMLIFVQNILKFNLGIAFFKVREYIYTPETAISSHDCSTANATLA